MRAKVNVGEGYTASGYLDKKFFVFVRVNDKLYTLKEAQDNGIVRVVNKDWYISKKKKYGELEVEVPDNAVIYNIMIYGKKCKVKARIITKGGEEEFEPEWKVVAERTINDARFTLEGYVVDDLLAAYEIVMYYNEKRDPKKLYWTSVDTISLAKEKFEEFLRALEEKKNKVKIVIDEKLREAIVTGDTYNARDVLKKHGFKWDWLSKTWRRSDAPAVLRDVAAKIKKELEGRGFKVEVEEV